MVRSYVFAKSVIFYDVAQQTDVTINLILIVDNRAWQVPVTLIIVIYRFTLTF